MKKTFLAFLAENMLKFRFEAKILKKKPSFDTRVELLIWNLKLFFYRQEFFS